MSSRPQEFASLLPQIVAAEDAPVHLHQLYAAIERDRPDLVDAEVEPPPSNAIRWRHELRWELETLVGKGDILRRKDLGRGLYSIPGR